MAYLSDTSPEAERVLCEILRTMPFERKWRQMGMMYRTAKHLHAAGIRARDPEATPEKIHRDWMRQAGLESYPTRAGKSQAMENEEVLRVVEHIVTVLQQLGVTHALAGSWASSIHGKMRFTHDADICVEPFAGKEEAFCQRLGEDYYVSLPAVRDAIRLRSSFKVIHTLSGFKVDLFIAKARPYDQSVLARRQPRQVGGDAGFSIPLVTPEDSILLKLEWYRIGGELSTTQWNDILGVFQTQGAAIDQNYLDRWAEHLGLTDLLARARSELAGT